VDLNDWILALHLLSAFALVAGLVLFWILVVAIRNVDTPGPTISLGRVAMVGNGTVIAGTIGTIVFGVWLAISREEYELWDGWVIAAIVLWVIASAAGSVAGKEYMRGFDRARELDAAGEHGSGSELLVLNRTSRGLLFHAVASAATLLILIDMIWKPGA
jgi:uncharacterized membrane protein